MNIKILCALAVSILSAGIAIAPMPVQAAGAGVRQTAQTVDKEETHIQVVIDLIDELPEQYSDFNSYDYKTFNRAKELWDELDRSEMFRLLDTREDIFDKYNNLFTQEKLAAAN